MNILERQSTESARAYAYRVLLYNIISLEFQPGEAINEKDIAADLGVSRTPVREALMELVKNGLVNIIPQKGSYISKIDFNIIEESRFLRLTIELAVLKLACDNISDDYVFQLKKNIMHQELMLTTDDVAILINIDNEFHKLFFEAVNKQWSYRVISSQMFYFDRYRYLIQKTLNRNTVVLDHKQILDAVINHDYDTAKDIISKHLGNNPRERETITKLYPDYFI